MTTDYERLRDENVAKNIEVLRALGLKDFALAENPAPPNNSSKKNKKGKKGKSGSKTLPKRGPKRRAPPKSDTDDDEDAGTPPRKTARVQPAPEGVRRSARNAGKTPILYNSDQIETKAARPAPVVKRYKDKRDESRYSGNSLGKRLHNPKRFGSIPGVEVGTWWETRAECSTDSIHAPFVAGIAGNSVEGAYSVALSGGYDDDVDFGEAFTYTGSGGRDLKGTKTNPKNLRTAPQSSDQTFENSMNRALQVSSETKKPIRVIRGFKLQSKYAPATGYRYDGLYTIEKAWMEKGLNPGGFKVCKYAFKRLPGQPPIPVRGVDDSDDDDDESDSDDSDEEDSDGTDEDEKADDIKEDEADADADVDAEGEADAEGEDDDEVAE